MTQQATLPVTICNNLEAVVYFAKHQPFMLRFNYTAVVRHFMGWLADDKDQIGAIVLCYSEQAFFMAPTVETSINVTVASNHYEGTMSAQAFGITASLFALSYVCEQISHLEDGDAAIDAYHKLRYLACDHPEHAQILRAID